MQLIRGAAIIFEVAGRKRDVRTRLTDRLAGVAGLGLREFLRARDDEAGHFHEKPAAVCRRHRAPRAVIGGARGLHGGVDVGAAPRGIAS